jgi:hypothetical protein
MSKKKLHKKKNVLEVVILHCCCLPQSRLQKPKGLKNRLVNSIVADLCLVWKLLSGSDNNDGAVAT